MSYVIVWEFEVPERCRAEFESAYARDGDWAGLFRRAPGFHGTELLACADANGRYLTVDRWENAESFAAFQRQFGREYAMLDARCEGLTSAERRLGIFLSG